MPDSNAVRYILSLQMHGDEAPGGGEIFQSWFVPGPNSIGGLADSETPEPFGPRNCGHQESPLAQHATLVTKPRIKTICFFIAALELVGWVTQVPRHMVGPFQAMTRTKRGGTGGVNGTDQRQVQ